MILGFFSGCRTNEKQFGAQEVRIQSEAASFHRISGVASKRHLSLSGPTEEPTSNAAPPLTVLRVVPATAIAANVLDLLPDVAVDREGHVVVVVLLQEVEVERLLAGSFLAAEGHDLNQAERRLFPRLLRGRGRSSAPRGEPGAVKDGGPGVHRRVIGRLEHRGVWGSLCFNDAVGSDLNNNNNNNNNKGAARRRRLPSSAFT